MKQENKRGEEGKKKMEAKQESGKGTDMNENIDKKNGKKKMKINITIIIQILTKKKKMEYGIAVGGLIMNE